MSEDAFIRRGNLRRLCVSRNWGPKDLTLAAGRRYSFWFDLLNDSKKSFGEKVARDIEQQLNLPRGWLDEPAALPVPSTLGAEEAQGQYVVPFWPFSPDLLSAVSTLGEDEMQRLEAVIRAHLGLSGATDG